MEKFWLIGIPLFLIITFIFWKLTRDYAKKINGKKMWTQWGTRMYYWHSAIMVSGGITLVIIFLLKCTKVL
jgi:hypothetical protein